MKKVKRLLLVVGLFAIVSCGGGGGGNSGGTSQSTPTPKAPSEPAITRSTAPRFTKTDFSLLNINESIDHQIIKEDMSNSWSKNTGSTYYNVQRNEIGFHLYGDNHRILNVISPTTMDVKTGGAAFSVSGDNLFNIHLKVRDMLTQYMTNANNLTLNMETGSYLFQFSRFNVNLSQTNITDILSGISISSRPLISGTGHKMFKFHDSDIRIDQDVNLDNPNDLYNQLIATNSDFNVNSGITISGTKDNQIGIQSIKNYYNSGSLFVNNNSGIIYLKGNNSVGAYIQAGKFSNSGIISVGKNSTGIYMTPYKSGGHAYNNSNGTIILGENSTGMYFYKPWIDIPSYVENFGKIESSSNNVIGIVADIHNQKNNPSSPDNEYVLVSNSNDAKITLKGDKSIGMYVTGNGKYKAINERDATITMGDSFDKDNPSIGIYNNNQNAVSINYGTIEIGKKTIGMAALGSTVINYGTINITKDEGVGIYLGAGSTGVNNGTITTVGSPKNATGVVVVDGSEFTNNGSIIINSAGGAGIVISGGIVRNYGDIQVSGGAVKSRNDTMRIEKRTIKSDNVSLSKNNPGIYLDTLGKTNPIEGLANLGLDSADLLIGAEATEKTNATEVTVTGDVLNPFNKSIKESNIEDWTVKSGSLVWEAEPEIKDNNIEKVILKKQSYVKYANSETSKAVAEALDEKYVNTNANTKDKQVFNDMNKLSTEKELAKTYKEVSGGQYINVQQRIYQTDEALDRELTGLKNDKLGQDGHHISTFVGKDEYKAKTPEVADSKNTDYGAAYLYNNTDNGWGIYAGAVINKFKLKDDGKSKENMTLVKAGAYKKFDLGAVDWTVSGEGSISWNEMKRRYVSGGVAYENKADYNSYGLAMKNELSKTYQLNNAVTFKPYGALNLGYGKFTDIKEKNSTLGLEIKGNSYYSVKPIVGMELGLSVPVGTTAKFKAGLGLGYEHELGKIENNENEARFIGGGTSWKLKGAKDEDRGGLRSELKAGFEAGNFNIFLTGGYNTRGKNSHVGINFGTSF